jgi:hypothetical protein
LKKYVQLGRSLHLPSVNSNANGNGNDGAPQQEL